MPVPSLEVCHEPVNLPIPRVHETPDVQNNHPINLRAIRLMWPEKPAEFSDAISQQYRSNGIRNHDLCKARCEPPFPIRSVPFPKFETQKL